MDMDTPVPLKRSLSKFVITLYGVGTILGAGIYVLVGKVAEASGIYTPLAFLFAAVIASFTAVSYAELSSRFPKSAGEAFYVHQAFNKRWLSSLTGYLVVFTGLVSAAVLTHGFVGYFQLFLPMPDYLAIVLFVLFLGAVAIWGINQSALLVICITLIEISGLLLILFLGREHLQSVPKAWQSLSPATLHEFSAVITGAFIAFYAYIGFEDMVNVAEEIKEPEKNLPAAIFMALAITTLLYFFIAQVLVAALPIQELSQSDAPLALFIEKKGYSTQLIGLISLIAIINGALAQIIMASRVLYGMAKYHNTAPRYLAFVYSRTQTPVYATLLVMGVVLVFTLGFQIKFLAQMTSSIILSVFIIIHLALIMIKIKQKQVPEKAAVYSIFFPVMGVILSTLFLLSQLLT